MDKTQIAIVMTTRNRKRTFFTVQALWEGKIPGFAKMFIVDDASDEVYCDADYRFTERAGIPKAKNKSLELAWKSGADHIFLVDDDVFPLVADWYRYYTESGIEHLSFSFKEAYEGVGERPDPELIDGFKIWEMTNGCFLYFTRDCIQIAGGFDERFGLGVYEHADLTRRIFNIGLTPHPNMDINCSEFVVGSFDKNRLVKRSFSIKERGQQLVSGYELYNKKKFDTVFIPFMSDGEIC